jgi:hypothetical protein
MAHSWINWLRAQKLTHLQFRVLTELLWHLGPAGVAFPSIARLADHVHSPQRSVIRTLHQLAAAGLIKLVEGADRDAALRAARASPATRANVWRVCWHPEAAPADPDITSGSEPAGDPDIRSADPVMASADPDMRSGEISKNYPRKTESSPPPRAHAGGLPEADRTPRPVLTPLPDSADWNPGDAGAAYARAKGLTAGQIAAEWERFRDWHLSRGKLAADWDAAWRLWIDRSRTMLKSRATAGREGYRQIDDWIAAMRADRLAREGMAA